MNLSQRYNGLTNRFDERLMSNMLSTVYISTCIAKTFSSVKLGNRNTGNIT